MFKGFSAESIDFLWGIRFNNNREWFREHKQDYETHLYRPMQALAEEVRANYQLEGTVLKTARIYRDVRYSSVPYKEHLWFCIREDNVFWSEHPSMYFQIEPEGGSLGFIYYAPKAAIMNLHRQKLLENPDRFRNAIGGLEDHFSDCSTRYKRPKPGCTPELEKWYQLKNCFFEQRIEVGEELFSPELPQRLIDAYRELEPLYKYFRWLETQPPTAEE